MAEMKKYNGFMVFHLGYNAFNNRTVSCFRFFEPSKMNDALKYMEELRKTPNVQFVTMASQTDDLVGYIGATGIDDNKLPNGEDYVYTKMDALSQRTVVYSDLISDGGFDPRK